MSLTKRAIGAVLVVKQSETLFRLDIGMLSFTKILLDIFLIHIYVGVSVIRRPSRNQSALPPLIPVEIHVLVPVRADVVTHVLSSVIRGPVRHVRSQHILNVTAP